MGYKQFIISIIVLFGNFQLAVAQPGKEISEHTEKIRTTKIAYINQKLDLSPTEAEKFWPIYNKFDVERWELRQNHHKYLQYKKLNLENLTDDKAEELIKTHLAFRQNDLDLEVKYLKDFKKAIPVAKIAKLFQVERSFQTEILKRLRDN